MKFEPIEDPYKRGFCRQCCRYHKKGLCQVLHTLAANVGLCGFHNILTEVEFYEFKEEQKDERKWKERSIIEVSE